MNPLFAKLQEIGGIYAPISENKLSNLLLVACCILKTRTTCLQKCRDEVGSITGERKIKRGTAYKRLIRVFQTGVVRPIHKTVFLLVLHMMHDSMGDYLIVDRTEFSIGKRWVNLLVMGIEWHGIFIPLVWKDLGKRKSSKLTERLELLDQLLAWWKASGLDLPVLQLLGDREFIGKKWIAALLDRKLQFVIRMKSNLKFPLWFKGQFKDRAVSLKAMERYMRIQCLKKMEVVVDGTHIVKLMRMPQENPKDKESFVLLLTTFEDWEKTRKAYRKRWSIECCFKHMKSNGFNLEDLNLEGDHKVDLIFAILTLVYVLAVQQGILNNYHQEVKIITYADGKSGPAESLFRFGLFFLKQQVQNLKELVQLILATIDRLLQVFINQHFICST